MRILVFGSLNIDHVYHLENFVRAGETAASEQYSRNEGGKGFNQAIALAKAGMDTYLAGAIGEDGLFLKKFLEETGVHTDFLRILPASTGHAIIQVNAQGQNSILLYGGANREITKEMIDETLSAFGQGEWILLQNEISNVPYIIERAKAQGMRVALNPSPAAKEMAAWPLEQVDLFLLNEVEGEDLTEEKNPAEMLNALTKRCPNSQIVLTLGTKGSIYAYQERRISQAAFPAQAVDTTGAGDTFTGYFLNGLLKEQSVQEALQLASKAAAISVTRKGAARSIPYVEEVTRAQ